MLSIFSVALILNFTIFLCESQFISIKSLSVPHNIYTGDYYVVNCSYYLYKNEFLEYLTLSKDNKEFYKRSINCMYRQFFLISKSFYKVLIQKFFQRIIIHKQIL